MLARPAVSGSTGGARLCGVGWRPARGYPRSEGAVADVLLEVCSTDRCWDVADSDRTGLVESGREVSLLTADGVGRVDVRCVDSGLVPEDGGAVLVACAPVSCEAARPVGCVPPEEGLAVTRSVTVTVSEKYAWVPPSSAEYPAPVPRTPRAKAPARRAARRGCLMVFRPYRPGGSGG